ncbi:hypothetical protein G6F31_017520 [Rhizopus arrhizus]|nr:hypothetical protein G6F31_017520 [Rhizopus arrhizus]
MLIVVGDALQTGGSVLTGSPHTDIEGRAVARVGDRVICARHGPGSIVTGDSTLVIDGQPVARDGDKASCGCALMAGKQQRAHVVAGGGGGGGQATLGALAKVAGIVAPLLKTMPLQTPPAGWTITIPGSIAMWMGAITRRSTSTVTSTITPSRSATASNFR